MCAVRIINQGRRTEAPQTKRNQVNARHCTASKEREQYSRLSLCPQRVLVTIHCIIITRTSSFFRTLYQLRFLKQLVRVDPNSTRKQLHKLGSPEVPVPECQKLSFLQEEGTANRPHPDAPTSKGKKVNILARTLLIRPEQTSPHWPAHDHIIPAKPIPGKAQSTLGVLDLFLESDRVILPHGMLGSDADLKEICQQESWE